MTADSPDPRLEYFKRIARLSLLLAGVANLVAGALLLMPGVGGKDPSIMLSAIPLPLKFTIGMTTMLLGGALVSWVVAPAALMRSLSALSLCTTMLGLWQTLKLWPDLLDPSMMESGMGMAAPTPFVAAFAGQLALLLCSGALLWMSVPGAARARAFSAVAGAVVAALSAVVVVAYGIACAMRGADPFWVLSIALAVALLMTGGALILNALAIERTDGETWPLWMPAPVSAGFLTVTICLWLALHWTDDRRLISDIDMVANDYVRSIERKISQIRGGLIHLSKAGWDMDGGVENAPTALLVFARNMIAGCESVFWRAKGEGAPTRFAPDMGGYQGFNLYDERRLLEQAILEGHKLTYLPERENYDASLIITLRDERGGSFRGTLGAIVLVEPLVSDVFLDLQLKDFTAEIVDGERTVGVLNPSASSGAHWEREVAFDPQDVPWKIRVWPTPARLAEQRSGLPVAVLVLGVALSLLLGWSVRQLQQARRRAHLLGDIKRGLEREILDRLNAEKSQKRLLQILEATTDYVTMADAEGRVVYLNSSARCAMGLRAKDSLDGRRLDDIHTSEASRKIREQALPHARSEGSWQGQTQLSLAEGRSVDASEIILAHYNRRGEVEYLSSVARDISDVKAAEQEQRRLQEKLLHAQRLESLGVLAGGIAHDFNNLLAAILGNIELTQQEKDDEAASHFLEQARVASVRASDLTKQMLAYSGKGQFALGPVNLNQLVEEMKVLLLSSLPKEVEFICEFADKLPPVTGDTAQLQQLVMSLVSNAAEASGDQPGRIQLKTRVVDIDEAFNRQHPVAGQHLEPGRYVEMCVKDEGEGMDRDMIEKIFDPFFTTKFTGRGLGLAAVLGIVRGHEGTIYVESGKGKGSRFFVLLPASLSDDSTQGGRNKETGKPLILVADDEAAIRDLTSHILKAEGFAILEATDGPSAVASFQKHLSDLSGVLLDNTMPGLTGREVMAKMREIGRKIPIVLTSGLSESDEDKAAPANLRPDAFLSKPFAPSDLVNVFKKFTRAPK